MRTLFFYIGYLIGLIFKIRIAYDNVFIFHSYAVGGAELVHLNILEELKKKSIMIFLYDTDKKNFLNEYHQYGQVLTYGKLDRLAFSLALGRLSSSLRFHKKPLKVFGYSIQEFYTIVKNIAKTEHEIIDIIHAANLVSIGQPKLIPRINTRIVIDENSLKLLHGFYEQNGLEKYTNRIRLIHNATELPDTVKRTTNELLKVVFVGRDSFEKRIHLFERIAMQCKEENLPVQLLLVGSDRKFGSAAETGFTSLGLISDKTKVRSIYAKSDVIMVTSIIEGFPMVIMEAMAHGCVPVSTSVGGIPYHIKNGVNGFLVHDEDEDEIVASFVKHLTFLCDNRLFLHELSENSVAYARTHFSKENFAKQYIELLS